MVKHGEDFVVYDAKKRRGHHPIGTRRRSSSSRKAKAARVCCRSTFLRQLIQLLRLEPADAGAELPRVLARQARPTRKAALGSCAVDAFGAPTAFHPADVQPDRGADPPEHGDVPPGPLDVPAFRRRLRRADAPDARAPGLAHEAGCQTGRRKSPRARSRASDLDDMKRQLEELQRRVEGTGAKRSESRASTAKGLGERNGCDCTTPRS